MVKAGSSNICLAFILRVKRLWNITSDITTVGGTVTFYCLCNFATPDSVTVGLVCMSFLLSHLVISC